jgi:uncharacterized glyoxalase superfamily protein PhnB
MPTATVIPVLTYPDVVEAAAWLQKAFGFKPRLRIGEHRIQMSVGDGSLVLVQGTARSMTGHEIMIRVEDVDKHYSHAVSNGVKINDEPQSYPFGERQYGAVDLAGHAWTFSQSIKDVPPADWGGEVLP